MMAQDSPTISPVHKAENAAHDRKVFFDETLKRWNGELQAARPVSSSGREQRDHIRSPFILDVSSGTSADAAHCNLEALHSRHDGHGWRQHPVSQDEACIGP